ncbi:hypothetical protein JRO89_XS02G0051900 [Xanthoceras sorbifolium]|uniref:1-acylglycerol-3-phosphate O-acyltransferase n=1 Tax=Xanthoceras sorbifolium TaxID=99658 RepID=A0ABQ8IEZ0_9ROSI|nr:hypothetical protein JRO89_XS02G0051900 [Xanthoceras sorbifolium]
MEVKSALSSNDGTSHRQLTPIRVIRGLICLLVLLSTAFMMLVYCGFLSAVVLRLLSTHYSRKALSFFFGAWLALWPFLFEKINKTKVVFCGETIPAKERVLLIANHRTEVDWMYLWDFALRKGCLGYIKYILKSSLMKLPVFGWGFHILEFISVERRWEIDESNLHKMLSTFKDPRDPLWLALFPEGTDFTEQKCIRSQKYAAENGLPILKNVLLPKTKGFCACLEDLRGSLNAGLQGDDFKQNATALNGLGLFCQVNNNIKSTSERGPFTCLCDLRVICGNLCARAIYDVTIGYKHRCPTFLDNVFGVDPSEVHIHVRYIPIDDIPTSEEEVAAWLMNAFRFKDHLLSDFYSQGHFPQPGSETELSTVKCLVNFMAVIALIGTFTFFTFFSSIWFKIYVSLSCAYMASATYFNVRPVPVLGFLKAMVIRKSPKY